MCEMKGENSSLYLPEFAGTRLRFAEAIVDRSDAEYPEIARLSYGTIAIDGAGHINSRINAAVRCAHLAQLLWLEPDEPTAPGNVIFAQDAFTLAGATWRPSAAQRQQIEAIFLNEQRAKRFRLAGRQRRSAGVAPRMPEGPL
jgi:hypothetical protein